jgi:hypothetical protein
MDSNVIITPNPITTTSNNNSANENENVSWNESVSGIVIRSGNVDPSISGWSHLLAFDPSGKCVPIVGKHQIEHGGRIWSDLWI